jgi:hypothetical protein
VGSGVKARFISPKRQNKEVVFMKTTTQKWSKRLLVAMLGKAMIIAVLAFGMAVVGCDSSSGDSSSGTGSGTDGGGTDGGGTGGGTGGGSGGGTVPETGAQVYRNGTEFTGNGTIRFIYYYQEGGAEKDVYIDAGTVTAGKLTLNLPVTLDARYLELFHDTPETWLTVSPSDVKVYWGRISLWNGDVSNRLYYHKETENSEDIILYVYSSTKATIQGTNSGEENGSSWSETYQLNLNAGWNRVYGREIDTGTGFAETYTTDWSGVPSGLRWEIAE